MCAHTDLLALYPSPSGASDPRLREDPGAWKRNSGGKGRRLGREPLGIACFLSLLQADLPPPDTRARMSVCWLEWPDVGAHAVEGAGHVGVHQCENIPGWLL